MPDHRMGMPGAAGGATPKRDSTQDRAQPEHRELQERAAAAAQAAAAVKHTVAAGETLSHIALKYYKSANRWKEIYEANKSVIGDNPNLIKVGQVLEIPNAGPK